MKTVHFISDNTFGAGGTNRKQQNTKTIQDRSKGSKCSDTNIFELLVIKHDRAYVNVESDESMGVMIMKCNTAVTRDGL